MPDERQQNNNTNDAVNQQPAPAQNAKPTPAPTPKPGNEEKEDKKDEEKSRMMRLLELIDEKFLEFIDNFKNADAVQQEALVENFRQQIKPQMGIAATEKNAKEEQGQEKTVSAFANNKVMISSGGPEPHSFFGDIEEILTQFEMMVEGLENFERNVDDHHNYKGFKAHMDKEKGELTLTFPDKKSAQAFILANKDLMVPANESTKEAFKGLAQDNTPSLEQIPGASMSSGPSLPQL